MNGEVSKGVNRVRPESEEPGMSETAIVESIHRNLKSSSNPVRKEKIGEYLKTSRLSFIGVELPEIHRIVKEHIKSLRIEELPPLMRRLWSIEAFETRLCAIDMMKVFARKAPVKEALSLVDAWIDDLDTWGLSDPLCQPCIGILLEREPTTESTLRRWRDSDNFWRRRCSVLPYLYLCLKANYKTEYDAKILEAVEYHIGDEEFFVGKAAGWVLRELSKRNASLVRTFIEKKKTRMTKLVLRESSKKI